MSHADSSVARPEFDFWEFVACTRCHAPFLREHGASPQVPFWVTECGHIVCNDHLNADHSCPQCGSQGIQVAPLQRKMEPPMSDWFRPATQQLDSLAFTTRVQIETLASLVRHYKKKCHYQRTLLERAKQDAQQLKIVNKKYADLKAYAQQMKEQMNRGRSRGSEASEVLNGNGKRPMLDSHRPSQTNSSPRSSLAPPAPERLTLQPQPFTPRLHRQSDSEPTRVFASRAVAPDQRPGSSRFAEQFSYDAPQHGVPPTAILSRAQHMTLRQSSSDSGFRPPTQSREDPQRIRQSSNTSLERQHDRTRRVSAPFTYRRESPPATTSSQLQMPPPPVPRASSTRNSSSLQVQADQHLSGHSLPMRPSASSESLQSNRFLPSSRSSSKELQAVPLQTQRFVPSTPSMSSRSINISPSGSRRHSGESQRSLRKDSGGQRVPFHPS